MKKVLYILAPLIIITIGVLFVVNTTDPETPTSHEDSATDNPVAPPKIDPIQEQLNNMTLDEKIAQMLIIGLTTPNVADAELAMLASVPYGGYILMGEAYGTLDQTRAMVENLQASAKIPLIITTDQEGGLVQRLQSVSYPRATYIPDMYSVGGTGDLNYAKTIGRVLAEELRAIGVNVDMAPDADVYSNPYNTVIGRRSFSSDPNIVANMSQSLADGLEQNGVVATYKHFPGHGDTAVDSHEGLPIINRTRAQLDQVDLVPFKNAIEHDAQLIMVGHIAMPQLTGDNVPATLSHKITTDILRTELGYQNLIITDGLNMGALINNYPESEIYPRAVEAGADLLLLPSDPQLASNTIKEQVSESRINESVYRILQFKHDHLADYAYLDASYFGSTEHATAAAR